MKSLFFTFLLSMFLCSSVNGQFSLLLEGGANYGRTKLDNNKLSDFFEQEDVLGYYISAVPKYQLTNLFKVNAELQYSLEGYKLKELSAGQIDNTTVMQHHYIRVIPELEMKVLGPLSVFAGANVGVLALEKINSSLQVAPFEVDPGFVDRTDFGVLAGVNVNFAGVNLSVKYNYGIKDINAINWTDRNGNILNNVELRNRFLQVGIGYLINFKI